MSGKGSRGTRGTQLFLCSALVLGADRYGSLKRGSSLHGSYHDNLNGGLERYGSLKRGKITPTMLEDTSDYIMPISSRILSNSLSQDLQHHSNELAALRQLQLQQQQMQYEQTIVETE
jgi:hypothetical protein